MYLAVDPGMKGAYVLCTAEGKLITFGDLGIPQKARAGENEIEYRERICLALKQVLADMIIMATNYGEDLEGVFVEETDWHRTIYPGIAKIMHVKNDTIAAMVIDKANRTTSRSLGRMEGMLLALCLDFNIHYLPITVTDAKFSTTAITGKKSKKKVDVQGVVFPIYPELNVSVKWRREALADAMSVMLAGLRHIDPLIMMKVSGG